jgi:hypothetical protein
MRSKMRFSLFILAVALFGGSVSALAQGDCCGKGNLLRNSDFNGKVGVSTRITATGGAGNSAAADWTLFNNTGGSIFTEIMNSTRSTGTMIHVKTDGASNGLVQTIGAQNTGPKRVIACAWIFIVSGDVGIGTGNGGNTDIDAVLKTRGQWAMIAVTNGRTPGNAMIIYSVGGPAEFYVDSASVSPL